MAMHYRIRIEPGSSEDVENPRDFDTSCLMLCWHGRYRLGDPHPYGPSTWKQELACKADDSLAEKLERIDNDLESTLLHCRVADGRQDYFEALPIVSYCVGNLRDRLVTKSFESNYFALPLYLYDHSGITMNTAGFSCPWDSGMVGAIVCRQSIFEGDPVRARKTMQHEVTAYDQFLRGDYVTMIAEESTDGQKWDETSSVFGLESDDVSLETAVAYFGEDYATAEIVHD